MVSVEAVSALRGLSLSGTAIDKIRLQAQSDTKEYGFSQLRLVLAFLRWHNLLREKAERIHSPLILLPVEMRKQRGTDDGFELRPLVSPREAEINPVLRHHLRDVYALELPETVDLTSFGNLKTSARDVGARDPAPPRGRDGAYGD